MGDTAPYQQKIQQTVPGQSTAATADSWNIGEVTVDGVVSSVSFTPEAAITGHATDYRGFVLVNKGQSGSGTTSIATLNTTTTLVADDEKALNLTGTLPNRAVAVGDILEFQSGVNGAGVVDPGGLVQVTISKS